MKELSELLLRLEDGTLSDADREELKDLLRSNEHNLEAARFLEMSATAQAVYAEAAYAEQEESGAAVTAFPSSRSNVASWGFAAAALLLVCVGILSWTVISKPSGFVTITAVDSISWAEESEDLRLGDILQGGKLAFNEGLLELTFNNGTTMLMEGPASFVLINEKLVSMARGKASVRVTEKGKGFTINTDDGKFIDIGTRFVIDVTSEDSTKLHVVDGLVKAKAK